MESNPDAFRQLQEEQMRAASAQSVAKSDGLAGEESKEPVAADGEEQPADGEDADAASEKLEEKVQQKREAIDKQQAFIEFKASESGQTFEDRIKDRRNVLKDKRQDIRTITDTLNDNKGEIDALKARLDRKEEERKLRLRDEQLRSDDMFEEQAEEIIDEEELVMLRKMKDLKKIYRDNFGRLKNTKIEFAEGQRQIDTIKEQLISAFEEWYSVEFQVPASGLDNAYNTALQQESLQALKPTESIFGGDNQEDDD